MSWATSFGWKQLLFTIPNLVISAFYRFHRWFTKYSIYLTGCVLQFHSYLTVGKHLIDVFQLLILQFDYGLSILNFPRTYFTLYLTLKPKQFCPELFVKLLGFVHYWPVALCILFLLIHWFVVSLAIVWSTKVFILPSIDNIIRIRNKFSVFAYCVFILPVYCIDSCAANVSYEDETHVWFSKSYKPCILSLCLLSL